MLKGSVGASANLWLPPWLLVPICWGSYSCFWHTSFIWSLLASLFPILMFRNVAEMAYNRKDSSTGEGILEIRLGCTEVMRSFRHLKTGRKNKKKRAVLEKTRRWHWSWDDHKELARFPGSLELEYLSMVYSVPANIDAVEREYTDSIPAVICKALMSLYCCFMSQCELTDLHWRNCDCHWSETKQQHLNPIFSVAE